MNRSGGIHRKVQKPHDYLGKAVSIQEVQGKFPQRLMVLVSFRKKVPTVLAALLNFVVESHIMVCAGYRFYIPQLVLPVKAF